MHKSGEIPTEKLLLALLEDEPKLNTVPSISYRENNGRLVITPSAPCTGFDYPSPHLNGMLDSLFDEYPDILFSMTLETNRGCPYSCTFCDWGVVKHKLFPAPMERVKAEIDWAAEHKIEFIICADANFGILERDEEIVEYLIESKRRTGYPIKFKTCLAKNSNEFVLRLNKKLCEEGMNNGVALAFQSISEDALENINRKNLALSKYRELVEQYKQANVPIFSELILGLPGETLDSFAKGIAELLAAGIHSTLEVYHCEVLPNAEFACTDYREKHGIKTVKVRQVYRHGSYINQDEIPEYSEYVVQTNTLPVEDWIRANVYAALVQGYHALGILQYFAVYLYWEHNISYERFYFGLIEYAKSHPTALLGEMFAFLEQYFRELSEGKGESIAYYNPRFGEITWPLGEALFLRTVFEIDRFYEELPNVLQQYNIDDELISELMRYQRAMVILPQPPDSPQSFNYDFPAYFAAAFSSQPPALQKKRAILSFPKQKAMSSWEDFARECVWYGKRMGALARKDGKVTYE